VRIAHLGDHHLRERDELPFLDRQLARAASEATHIVFSGDLLDRWDPALLVESRERLAANGLIDPDRLTIIHGNHDVASSGGWPRRRGDILRMVLRFWDPPPLLARRRERFTELFSPVAAPLPFEKRIAGGRLRLLAIDSTPFPWAPFTYGRRALRLRTALGAVRLSDVEWLESLPEFPSLLLMHHYPLPTPALLWNEGRVVVPMHVRGPVDRLLAAAARAGVRLIACGHVHRTQLDWHDGIAVGLQGQSGAGWANRPLTVYELEESTVRSRVIAFDGQR
jgi:hypothetical protein